MQTCTFRIEYTLDNVPGREFGLCYMGTPATENVALSVATAGWAKVCTAGCCSCSLPLQGLIEVVCRCVLQVASRPAATTSSPVRLLWRRPTAPASLPG